MLAWGRNDSGQLGAGDTDDRHAPAQVFSTSTFVSVACGSRTTLGVNRSGLVLGFGSPQAKVLGEDVEDDAVVIPRALEGLERIASVSTRGAHAVALDEGGRVYSWGRGEQDYQRVTRPLLLPFPRGTVVRLVGAGRMHSVAVDQNGALFTWGSSDEGQTGQSHLGYVAQPTLVQHLPGPVTTLACGSRHTLIVVKGSRRLVMGFGGNSYAQLGLGDREPRFAPVEIPMEVDSLAAHDEGEDINVACGYRHSFIYTKRRLYGFGWNSNYQVCAAPVAVLSAPVPVNEFSRIDNWPELHFAQVAAGGRHTIVMLGCETHGDYTLVGFGRNESGELGLSKSNTGSCRYPSLILSLSKPNQGESPQIACGWEHSVVTFAGCKVDAPNFKYSWLTYVKGDLDACLAQFVNCVVLLRLVPFEARMGVAKTVALSNLLFAAWGYRMKATALPHGLNTVALFALQMGAYEFILARYPNNTTKALNACFFCTVLLGMFQVVSAFTLAPLLKRFVPRSALAASVAGVALVFITTRFTADIFASPQAGLASLMVLLVGFGAKTRMPFGIPVAFVALFIGWLLSGTTGPVESLMGDTTVSQTYGHWIQILFDTDLYPLVLTVVLPLLIVNIVNDLACVEQARASGDLYDGTMGLVIDASITLFGTLVFGNPFPTCIYVGHSSFKGMGATSMYSLLNSVLLTGLVLGVPSQFVSTVEVIPQVATVGFLVWIGCVVTTEAFKTKRHGVAVVLALVPALASWRLGSPVQPTAAVGLETLSDGYMVISMILGSAVAKIIDRDFLQAAVWLELAGGLSLLGWIHGKHGSEVAKGYAAAGAVVGTFALAHWHRKSEDEEDPDDENTRSNQDVETPSFTRPREHNRTKYGTVADSGALGVSNDD